VLFFQPRKSTVYGVVSLDASTANAFFIALCVKISFFSFLGLFVKSFSEVKNSFNWVQRIQHTTLFKDVIEIRLRQA